MWGIRLVGMFVGLSIIGGMCGMARPAFAEEGDVGTPVTEVSTDSRWVFSIRGGVVQGTQDHVSNGSPSLGGAGSLQLLYQFNPHFRFGMTVDGQQQALDVKGGKGKFGDLFTVAVMPTIEMRPFLTTSAIPYLSVGLGMNFNMFSAESGVPTLDYNNTFAARIAGGVDVPLTAHWSFNTEVAWRLNKGEWTQLGYSGRYDATAVLGLIGIRYLF
ncbi:MAG: hypothetical protein KIT40_11640 [Nitrospira sp.]|nr:hypothetical protein [Nitrospira sp.]